MVLFPFRLYPKKNCLLGNMLDIKFFVNAIPKMVPQYNKNNYMQYGTFFRRHSLLVIGWCTYHLGYLPKTNSALSRKIMCIVVVCLFLFSDNTSPKIVPQNNRNTYTQ